MLIDTHQHLWDLQQLRLPWIGAQSPLRRSYLPEDYDEATAGLGLAASVYMEVDVAPEDRLKEAEYVFDLCSRDGNPMAAAVLGGEPASPDFSDYLAVLRGSPFLRGIRQVLHSERTPPGFCIRPEFLTGLRHLGECGLSFDLCMRPGELTDAAQAIAACPETLFILDHCGNANIRWDAEHDAMAIQSWREGISRVAVLPNVICKISGIVASAAGGPWSDDDLRPYIRHCLAEFGESRVVFGGDWPVCTLGAEYVQWVASLRRIVSDLTPTAQARLFSRNAAEFYRLEERLKGHGMSSVADRLAAQGWTLPTATPGKLAPAVRTGNLVYTSGAVSQIVGKVGGDVTVEEGYVAAREAILGCLASVQWAIGDLDRVTRVVKLLGMVNCAEGFCNTPAVIHGATDTLVELFGPEVGWHARSAIGVYQLPSNVAVEIELIVEVRD